MDERIARIQERVRAQSGPALAQWLEEAEPPLDGNMKAHKFDIDPRASYGVQRAQTEPVAVEYRERAVGDAPMAEGFVPDAVEDGGEEAAAFADGEIECAVPCGGDAAMDEMAGAAAPVYEEV